VDQLGSVSFHSHSHVLNEFWIASRLVCSLLEAMAGSLCVATTAVSSTEFAVVDSGEVGVSAVYCRKH
jgi:hypothetical protein